MSSSSPFSLIQENAIRDIVKDFFDNNFETYLRNSIQNGDISVVIENSSDYQYERIHFEALVYFKGNLISRVKTSFIYDDEVIVKVS